MDNQEQTAQVSQPTTTKTVKQKMPLKKKLLVIVLAIVAVFVVLLLFVNQATQGVVTASDTFVNAIQAKDSGAAYGQFSAAAKETVTSEAFDGVVQRIAPILNSNEKMTDKSVSGESGKDATGKVVYEIKGSDGKTYTFTVNLVKEGDTWKVQNFDSTPQ